MKLLIAIHSLDYMHTEFVKSLVALTNRLSRDGVDYDVRIESGTLVHIAREKLAQLATAGGYTDVLWLDSDMVFTEDLLEDLQFSGNDFVTGIAHARRKPFISCVFKSLIPVERYASPDEYPKETFEIAGCGFACVLIKTDIIRDVRKAHPGVLQARAGHRLQDLRGTGRAARAHRAHRDLPGRLLPLEGRGRKHRPVQVIRSKGWH